MDRAKTDFELWLFGFAKTLDEHDPVQPVKPFPDKPHTRWLARMWATEPLVALAKSRQMNVTWFCVLAFTWEAAYHKGRRYFFQSVKEEKADELLDRVTVCLENLPPGLKPNYQRIYTRVKFPDMGSEIVAVSQDSDSVLSETASGIFADEMSAQPNSEAAYYANQPTVVGGGRYWSVGTPRGQNFFYKLYADRLTEPAGD